MAKVVSVNISEKKGTLKKPVSEIELKLRHGIVGRRPRRRLAPPDLSAGGGKHRHHAPPLPHRSGSGHVCGEHQYGGHRPQGLPVGTHLRIGETEVEVTQIGKECHNDCAVKQAVGSA